MVAASLREATGEAGLPRVVSRATAKRHRNHESPGGAAEPRRVFLRAGSRFSSVI